MSEELLSQLSEDVMAFGKVFFPNHFTMETPDFHYQLMQMARRNQFLAIASPRGSAKSTRISFLYPAHKIIFKKEPFIVLISNTFKKSAMYLDAIKMELSDNKMLKAIIGDTIKFSRDAEGDTIFQHADGFKTWFLCRGVDQLGSLRGVKFGAHRPGLILLDDIEDDELVRSQERRLQLQKEFDDVFGIGGTSPKIGHAKTQIIAVGTILHDDSMLSKLIDKTQYTMFEKVKFQAHVDVDKPSEHSLWPEKWSVTELREMMKNNPDTYAKEMQNDPVAGENTRFRRENFRYWKETSGGVSLLDANGNIQTTYAYGDCRAAISCDLAWKEKRVSDSCAIVPGLLTPRSEILVLDYIHQKGIRPDKLSTILFDMEERLATLTGSVIPIGFEKAMLENVNQWLLRREMQRRNKFLLTRELVWDADKNTRIETRLQPRYSQHVIYHKHGMGELETQLVRFPSGTHDDLIDALQGLIQLLQFPKDASKPSVNDQFMKLRKWNNEHQKITRPKKYTHTGNRSPFPWQVVHSPL